MVALFPNDNKPAELTTRAWPWPRLASVPHGQRSRPEYGVAFFLLPVPFRDPCPSRRLGRIPGTVGRTLPIPPLATVHPLCLWLPPRSDRHLVLWFILRWSDTLSTLRYCSQMGKVNPISSASEDDASSRFHSSKSRLCFLRQTLNFISTQLGRHGAAKITQTGWALPCNPVPK